MGGPRSALVVTELDPSVYPQPAYLARAMAGHFGSAELVTLSRRYSFTASKTPEVVSEKRVPSRHAAAVLSARVCHLAASLNPSVIVVVNEPLLSLLPLTVPFCPAALRGAYFLDYWEDAAVTQTLRLKLAHGLTSLDTRWLDFVIDCQAERLALRDWACSPGLRRFVLHNMPPVASVPQVLPPRVGGPRPRILYAGAGGRGAYLESLLQALAGVRGALEARLFLRAPDDRRRHLAGLVADYGLEGRVRVFPPIHREALNNELAQADIGVCFYNADESANVNTRLCAPNKLYEYLAHGVAPLVSPNPTLRFVERNGLGHVVNPADPAGIAAALQSMMQGRAYLRMGAAARAAFLEERFHETEFEEIADYFHTAVPG